MDPDNKTTLSYIRRYWWLILWTLVVLAGLTFAEFMPESLAELHWLEMLRGRPSAQEHPTGPQTGNLW